ncbi:MAG: hypothetical protein KKF44_11615, partial [Nanoarchaeota archaeon]|nr:hypothetical protein [Nanoarchaeota archaeon]
QKGEKIMKNQNLLILLFLISLTLFLSSCGREQPEIPECPEDMYCMETLAWSQCQMRVIELDFYDLGLSKYVAYYNNLEYDEVLELDKNLWTSDGLCGIKKDETKESICPQKWIDEGSCDDEISGSPINPFTCTDENKVFCYDGDQPLCCLEEEPSAEPTEAPTEEPLEIIVVRNCWDCDGVAGDSEESLD